MRMMNGWMCGLLFAGLPAVALAQSETKTEVTASGYEVQEAGETGLELGLRYGFQGAAGTVVKNSRGLNGEVKDLAPSDASNGALPLQLDLGVRVSPKLFLGVYGSWANSLEKENPWTCPAGFECSTNQYRAGIQAQYHFAPSAVLDPWVGLGTGIIITHSDNSGTAPILTPAGPVQAQLNPVVTDRGPEYANLALGLNLTLGSLQIGPVVHVAAASNTVRTGEIKATIGNTTQTLPLSPVENGTFFNYVASLRVGYVL